MKVGDRVRVVARFEHEPELEGMTGNVIRTAERDVGVFLDGDKYPTTFRINEVEVIE